MKNISQNNRRPFLQWVGGKRRIANQIAKYIPSAGLNNYYEPFLGGGALFFHIGGLFKKSFFITL